MSIQQLTAEEAQALMTQDQNIAHLDVRTVPEFEAGHPPAALNIPVVVPNPALRKMVPNPDFLSTGSRSPQECHDHHRLHVRGRSQFAAEVLEDAGYNTWPTCKGIRRRT